MRAIVSLIEQEETLHAIENPIPFIAAASENVSDNRSGAGDATKLQQEAAIDPDACDV